MGAEFQAIRFDDLPSMVDQIEQVKTDIDFSSILAELQVLRTQVDMLHQSRDRPEGKEGLCTRDSLTVSVDLRAPEERYSDSVGSLADSYTLDFSASGSLRMPDGCDGNPEASELGAP